MTKVLHVQDQILVCGLNNWKLLLLPSYTHRDHAIGSLSIVPVLMLVAADIFLSGNPSDATPPGEPLVLATVKVCSASTEKCAVTIFLSDAKNGSGLFLRKCKKINLQ